MKPLVANDEFVRIWNSAKDIKEVTNKTGLSYQGACGKATFLRKLHLFQNKEPIKKFRPSTPQKIKWKKEWDKLLGTMGDMDLASRIGVCYANIRQRREIAGIPTFKSVKSKEQLKNVKKITDMEFLSLSNTELTKKYNIPSLLLNFEKRSRNLRKIRIDQLELEQSVLRRAAIAGMMAAVSDVPLARMGQALGLTGERVRQIIAGLKCRA